MVRAFIILGATLIFTACNSDGGAQEPVQQGAEVSDAKHDSSPPLRDLPPAPRPDGGPRVHPVKPLPRPAPADGGTE